MAQAKKAKTKERDTSWVWKSPRVKKLMAQPFGSPVDFSGLTEEERLALAWESLGMWADRKDMEDSVMWVRKLRRGRKLDWP